VRRALVVLAAGVALAACGRDADRAPENVRLAGRDSALTLGAGDVAIVNTDSSVEMAVVGQNIVVRLSDKTMNRIRQETDTLAVRDSGIGGSIERLVKSTVRSALSRQVTYPVSQVDDARYENGEIKLIVGGRQPALFGNTKVSGRRLMESFRPEDAERFVAAVNARKQAR